MHFYPQMLGQNYWDVFDWPQRLVHQNFGLDLTQDISQRSGVSEVINDKNKFEIRLDCNHFKPEELVVKTIGDSVVIEGKHEERDDSTDHKSYVSRQFSRRYTLPVGCDAQQVVSSLDSKGVLTISAKKQELPEVKTKEVPIAVTNAADNPIGEEKSNITEPFVLYLKSPHNDRPRIGRYFASPKLAITYYRVK